MAFKNAQSSRVLLGALNYSGYATKVSFGLTQDALEVTTIIDTAKKYIVGATQASYSIAVNLDTDTTAGGLWSNATTFKTTQPSPLSYAPSGLTTGSEVWLVGALESTFSSQSTNDGLVTASLAGIADGSYDPGLVVEDLTSISATGNGTARDQTTATTNGGVAHLHLTAFSGVTSTLVTIEHSVDGATAWATLVTFAAATGLTSERVVVAAGTTVRRYLRVVDTLTGTPVYTRSVSFARR
jgi:hypothetical protein